MKLQLNNTEIHELMKPVNGQGWFQSLLERPQGRVDQATGDTTLARKELERIPKYAFDYGDGGFESRLIGALVGTLGKGSDVGVRTHYSGNSLHLTL